jgi:hypothetical protein
VHTPRSFLSLSLNVMGNSPFPWIVDQKSGASAPVSLYIITNSHAEVKRFSGIGEEFRQGWDGPEIL